MACLGEATMANGTDDGKEGAEFEKMSAKAPDPAAGLFPNERKEAHRSLWLLWTGCGVAATLDAIGASRAVSQGAFMICLLGWVAMNVDVSAVIWEILFSFADIFFKEVGVRGTYMVPSRGPVVFACAPHANQFLDPLIVAGTSSRDDIGYITAAATFRRQFVGTLAKLCKGIPVERAQDLASAIRGSASAENDEVVGEGTAFSSEVEAGGVLYLEGCDPMPVLKVIDNTHIKLKYPIKNPAKASTLKASPKVDQDTFFEKVYETLQAGKAVGVFPEGGSHDQTHFLEMKPGVAIFALGGSQRMRRPVPVVPVGLNYFKGHRFRSRVFVDYGEPIYPSEELVEAYSSGDSAKRRAATTEFLGQIREGLKNVTVETENYHQLSLFWALRRLYVPSAERLDAASKQALTRGFAEGYSKFKDNPRVQELMRLVDKYTLNLKQYGVQDYMVAKRMKAAVEAGEEKLIDRTQLLLVLSRRLALLLFWGFCWIPAGIINAPFVIITRHIAQKRAKEAVAKSSVKIAGRDVLATWKILIAMGFLPAMHILYTLLVYIFLGKVYAVIFFFFMPFVSWHNLRAQENIVRLYRSLSPLFLLFKNKHLAEDLVMLREHLRRETTAVVKEVGWGIPMQFATEDRDLAPSTRSRSFSDFGSDLHLLGD